MISRRVDLKNMVLNTLKMKNDDLTFYELLDFTVQYFGNVIPFREPDPYDMLDESEEDLAAHDTRMFSQYIGGIENASAPLLDYYEYDEYIVKYNYNDREITLGATYSEENPFDDYSNCFTATVIVPIETQRRGHIGTISDFMGLNIADYTDKLEEYDSKYAEEYREYFSKLLPKIKEKKESVSEKFVFTEAEKYFLSELIKEFKIPASVVLKDGYLCIDCLVTIHRNYTDMIAGVVYFFDFITQIIDKYMYL